MWLEGDSAYYLEELVCIGSGSHGRWLAEARQSELIVESFLAAVTAQMVGNGKDLASLWVRPGERRVRVMARGPGREGQTAWR